MKFFNKILALVVVQNVQIYYSYYFYYFILVAKDFSQYEPIFLQMSEDKKTVNAFELADLLEACLPNGM